MDFIDQLKQYSKRVGSIKDDIQTEEATKTSIIMPFFALLGYDVFNPNEFIPEFTADVGLKKGEKVDYAILRDDEPIILIEAKWVGEPLQRHDSQLLRYFHTTTAKFGILTNGLIYRFYTDLDSPNKMDDKPFLEFNILDIKESQVVEIKKFHKSNFDLENILDTASELKYSNEFKIYLSEMLQNPSDDFVRLFLSNTYDGMKTQNIIDKFRPILKKAMNNYISELMSDKIKSALNSQSDEEPKQEADSEEINEVQEKPIKSQIVTTPEELEAYFIVKSILKDVVPMEDITYKDTVSYLNILYKSKPTKWLCRLEMNSKSKLLYIPDEKKKSVRYFIKDIYEIEKYKDQLVEVLKRYIW